MCIWLVCLKRLLNIISGDQTWYFLSNESTNQMQQLITGLLLVIQIPLNMFWASLCPSSGAYQLQPLLPPRFYGKPEAAAAVDSLLIMGIMMPETC
jgi:hypothetical protein